ncbi:MAG: hypothetical protein DIZ80_12905 [endosymbiont of Galathealinum brachiosum]|uniref:PEP-CTERM protein-sorting domain-containing protein n=1 Tax=endosymbiont of Galathealinum brachiosum TaxID=2200906 RepID=A0A370D9Q2_9GAMM|nr:MAG: hypothetical protein DIZ80_12905 [endosymbiont of Galathealinum brachiosum]
MKIIIKHITAMLLIMGSASTQAMNVWVVESGANPFLSSQNTLSLSAGTTSLDLYYDVEGDTSYGYDFIMDITGSGSISNVGGGDSDLGDVFGNGWRQFGGDIYGEVGSSVLGFSFDFTAAEGASLLIAGTYTDGNFDDTAINASTLAAVSPVPVPAAVWLFGSGLIGLCSFAKRRNA